MRRYVAVGSFALVWSACESLSTFHLNETSEATIERGTLVEDLAGDLGFGDFLEMDISESATLRNAGVEPGDIREVRLEAFTLDVTSPEGGDLSFIRDLAFYVEADGLPRERIAWQDTFPEGAGFVEMNLDDVDLTDYAVSETMSITTEVTGGRPDEDTTVDATVDIAVGATVQGACNQLDGDE